MEKRFHLYMDESGAFEQIDSGRKKGSLIFGLLVPEEEKDRLSRDYKALVQSFGFSDFRLHGRDAHKQSGYVNFQERLVERTLTSGMRPFTIRYEQDLRLALPHPLSEEFAANRYMMMAQAVLEHILFLCPELWDTDLVVSFHPSNRIFPVDASDSDRLRRLREMGFYCPQNRSGSGDAVPVFVWDAKGLRVYLHHLCLQYTHFQNITGSRSWEQIEMPVASPGKNQSNDPLVYWVDVLTGFFMWKDRHPLNGELQRTLLADVAYGMEDPDYQQLVRLYLNGNFYDFLIRALQEESGFKRPYYKKQMEILMVKALAQVHRLDEKALFRLEASADRYLRRSRGNWGFVLRLVDRLFSAIDAMPQERRNRPDIQRLLLRLHSHRLSGYNHRSEVAEAIKAFEAMNALNLGPRSVEDWREEVANANRRAVTEANLFNFEESRRQLLPAIQTLEESRSVIVSKANRELTDPLLGKLLGTMGQNLAFLAPRRPHLFQEAEETFTRARAEFSTPADQVRQDIGLVHLYLDRKAHYDNVPGSWSNAKDAWNTVNKAWSNVMLLTGFQDFLDHPGPETAKHKQFMLHILLKLTFSYVENLREWERCVETYRLEELKKWFGSAVHEHPFEFICAYLGRMAIQLNMTDRIVDSYFDHALRIPGEGEPSLQPTLQMIRAQIRTWRALDTSDRNLFHSRKEMQDVLTLLREIGNRSDLHPILHLQDDRAVGGWFEKAWNSLNRVNWEKDFDPQVCDEFLSCFTFNYH